MVTFLPFCWPQQTRSGGWEETLCGHLVHDAGQVQDESDDNWGRVGTEETEYNKASSNERFVDKKVQSFDGGCGEVAQGAQPPIARNSVFHHHEVRVREFEQIVIFPA